MDDYNDQYDEVQVGEFDEDASGMPSFNHNLYDANVSQISQISTQIVNTTQTPSDNISSSTTSSYVSLTEFEITNAINLLKTTLRYFRVFLPKH